MRRLLVAVLPLWLYGCAWQSANSFHIAPEWSEAERQTIVAALEAWDRAMPERGITWGPDGEAAIVQSDHCEHQSGSASMSATSAPVIKICPEQINGDLVWLYTTAVHEIGHALAGHGEHGGDVMRAKIPRTYNGEITRLDIELVRGTDVQVPKNMK